MPRKIYLVHGSIARANKFLGVRGAATSNLCAAADSKMCVLKKKIYLKQLFDYTFNECRLQPNTFMKTVYSNYCSNLSTAFLYFAF